jgi:hypothetical protein
MTIDTGIGNQWLLDKPWHSTTVSEAVSGSGEDGSRRMVTEKMGLEKNLGENELYYAGGRD